MRIALSNYLNKLFTPGCHLKRRLHQCNVVVCPGQGSQYVGMLQNYEENHMTRKILETANGILSFDLLKLCKNGPKETLDRTLHCQPAVSMATMTGYEVLKERDRKRTGKPLMVEHVAGYSVGEIPALYIAQRIQFDEAIRIIKERAIAMDDASRLLPSGMVSMQGLSFSKARQVCEDLTCLKNDREHIVSVAIEQYRNSVSLGGSYTMLNHVMNREHSLIKDPKHIKLTKLAASGAFHTSYMIPAQERLNRVLENINITESNVILHCNVTGKPYTRDSNLKELLVRQIAEPVLWYKILQNITGLNSSENDLKIFEIGTGKQLKTMFGKIDRKLLKRVENIEM